jgi:hypothetical protein
VNIGNTNFFDEGNYTKGNLNNFIIDLVNAAVELSLTMYKNTTALISDAQPLLAAQVLQLQLITGYVLLLTKSLLTADC